MKILNGPLGDTNKSAGGKEKGFLAVLSSVATVRAERVDTLVHL